jgi:hypothetical protein
LAKIAVKAAKAAYSNAQKGHKAKKTFHFLISETAEGSGPVNAPQRSRRKPFSMAKKNPAT